MLPPQPPLLESLPYGSTLVAGCGVATVIADFDFETYSEAGFIWDEATQKYEAPPNANGKGLPVIGVAAYATHPSTEVLSLAYDLKDGRGKHLWMPHMLAPMDLFNHLAQGGLLEAWNVAFEWWIWSQVCTRRYGWPELPVDQLRCAMAKSRAHALPGHLADAGEVLNISHKKHADGKRLLNKFSMPRNPTKTNPRRRIQLADDPVDANRLCEYNLQDIAAEAEISSLIPDLSPIELEFWQIDQRINRRGVQLDRETIDAGIRVIEGAQLKYNAELRLLTSGHVQYASEVAKITHWLEIHQMRCDSLDAENVTRMLADPGIFPEVRRVLEIRQAIGSAAVKKLYAMSNSMTAAGRVHDLFVYHAGRTGRAAGRGVQPQNLPNSGMTVNQCHHCNHYFNTSNGCPWCGTDDAMAMEWNPQAVEDAITCIRTGSVELVEMFFGDAMEAVSGCLRGMFIAAPEHDYICSDFAAIEAVVLAALAGEQWQLDVFATHGMIYEATASKITGVPIEEFIRYKKETGKPHPDRKIGKLAALSSGYQGWIGAWKAFGADEFLSEEQIKQAILAWRAASPKIVEFWGGQMKYRTPALHGIEGAAVNAILHPGNRFDYCNITYIVLNDVLYCTLPSGRKLTYHQPRLRASERRAGTYAISFMGWNSNPKYGAMGWVRMDTYGGKCVENIVQGVARDILAHAIVNLEKAGYPIVLHVHDEIVAEVPEGVGSVENFEQIMSIMPPWAAGWPIKASGGWRAKRYAK